jgi:6-pyruvoyl-tetrahydropterin synthase
LDVETGFVVDFAKLSEAIKRGLIDYVDHHHLGQGTAAAGEQRIYRPTFGETFYPSSENLVLCFARILRPLITELGGGDQIITEDIVRHSPLQLEEVALEETCTCKATWRRTNGGV